MPPPVTKRTCHRDLAAGGYGPGNSATARRAVRDASYLASHDAMTGLPNRTLFGDRRRQALVHNRRHGGELAVLCIGLDHFKDVNDTLGHAAGDELLPSLGIRTC